MTSRIRLPFLGTTTLLLTTLLAAGCGDSASPEEGDTAWEEYETIDGELVEISRNYFAQAADGTVCYFGEEVDDYEGGQVSDHGGAWRADDPGNRAGIIMPALPAVGTGYWQEIAPGVAEDRARVIAAGEPISLPEGEFTDTVEMLESSAIEPGTSEKIYVRGVGMVFDSGLEQVSITRPNDAAE